MSGVVFRPAAMGDEQALLRMMRNLAEQEPGAYFFDEQAVREVLRKFLASPDLGQAWIFFDGKLPSATSFSPLAIVSNIMGAIPLLMSFTSSQNIAGRELAAAPCNLSKCAPASWE